MLGLGSEETSKHEKFWLTQILTDIRKHQAETCTGFREAIQSFLESHRMKKLVPMESDWEILIEYLTFIIIGSK